MIRKLRVIMSFKQILSYFEIAEVEVIKPPLNPKCSIISLTTFNSQINNEKAAGFLVKAAV
jgi:hypothetical protein